MKPLTSSPAPHLASRPDFAARERAPWIADRGDGTYRNPVLYADYSDPDAIRVGEDYWLTASSFNHVPALPILHSRDLINWTLVNHGLPYQIPHDHFSVPRHGQGVWAPALRYHAEKFWIFYPDPDFGLYVITADDPRGAWSPPHLVKAGKGLIDPCPLWDEDGRVYLVHAWARSRSGISNRVTLHQLTPDAKHVIDDGKVIIDGDKIPGWNTIEGPKLYKRAGYYYIFAPAGGVATGYQAVFRSRNIQGPYEPRITLDQGKTAVNGPHQGAWVETPAGEHWFFHFQELPAYGRVVHLQPMVWREDDWPTMGDDPAHRGIGEPVSRHAKPALPTGAITVPATSDEFDAPSLGLQWQWQANPRDHWASLAENPHWLRLRCLAQPEKRSHWCTPHLLLQKFPGPSFVVTAQLRFSPNVVGDSAGLMIFGHDYAWIGLRQSAQGTELTLATCLSAHKDGNEQVLISRLIETQAVTLRVEIGVGARCRFAASLDGLTFDPVGAEFAARSSYWVGAKVGLFASTTATSPTSGHADFDWFRVTA